MKMMEMVSEGQWWTARRRWPAILAVAASVLVPVSLTVAWWIEIHGDTYRTERGEQRCVVLQDGSVVQLNTLTRMAVHFDDTQRRIELPDGEAFFRVARDASRPFYVETPDAVVRAVSTQFNVYARATNTQVAVVEGKVQVAARIESGLQTHGSAPANPIALTAQQSIVVSSNTSPPFDIQRSQMQAAPAWIQRRLVFQDDRVDRAADEFNRYNRRQIHVDDPAVAALHVSGEFSADDPMMLVNHLQKIQHVKVTPSATGVVLGSRL
jgi:transmembrane sensor